MLYNQFELYPFKLKMLTLTESPFHVNNDFEIIYILEGSLSISFTSNSNILNAKKIEIININEPVKLTAFEKPCKIAILSLSREYIRLFSNQIENRIYNCSSNEFYDSGASEENCNLLKLLVENIIIRIITSKKGDLSVQAKRLLDMINENFDDIKNLLIKSDSNLRSERFNRIIDYIRSHSDQNISLDNLMKTEYISKTYLSKEFNRYLKRNFKEIHGYYRVIVAARLLLKTSYSVEKISHISGFSSMRYFYKYFTRYYGCTPNSFRLTNKKIEYKSSKLSPKEITNILYNITNKFKFYQNNHKQNSISIETDYELRINYQFLDKLPLKQEILTEYKKNINIEINLSYITEENIEEVINKIINLISDYGYKISIFTLIKNLNNDEVIINKINMFKSRISKYDELANCIIKIVYYLE